MTILLTATGRTFKNLQDEVLAFGFSEARYRTRVKTWLNEGLSRVTRQAGLPQLEQTALVDLIPGQSTYAIPEHLRLLSVRGGGMQLTNVSTEDLDDEDGATGPPVAYSLFGGQLVVTPVPRQADQLAIRVRGAAQTMVADDDVPGMPDGWTDLLVTYALSRAFRAEDDYEAAGFYSAEWKAGLGEMRADVQYPDESVVRQVNGMMGGSPRPRFSLP